MLKFDVHDATIKSLFEGNKPNFLIPNYQRPYAWTEEHCQTLWDDIFNFAIPDEDATKFNNSQMYFLGPIVVFRNTEGKMEVIDGQQRLTTLMLLLRAFYDRFKCMQDTESKSTRGIIEKCIWKTDEFEKADLQTLKIDSEVAMDDDKAELIEILNTGKVNKKQKSRYATNFSFFQECVNNFLTKYPSYFAYMPIRLLQNCIVLSIEAESQESALQIFYTLNDRGLPLSDADIFKAHFYKYYKGLGADKIDDFIDRWKNLEKLCRKVFQPIKMPMNELFTRYMYYVRAVQGIKTSTTEALRKFYEKGDYALLKRKGTLESLETLAHFWEDVTSQNKERFSDEVLRRLFVLSHAPNSMWTHFISVYFLAKKNEAGLLDEKKFLAFLDKTIGFIWTYAVTNPGVSALRAPMFAEMLNIVNGKPIKFGAHKFEVETVRSMFGNFNFSNAREITRSMVAWWALQNEKQELLPLKDVQYQIEHICSRSRDDKHRLLKDDKNLESLGNKALLEDFVNIRASDYSLRDKADIYAGGVDKKTKKRREGTKNKELLELSKTAVEKNKDFTDKDIQARYERIMNAFIKYLRDNELIKNDQLDL